MIKWERWDKSVIEKVHGKVYYYRDLYEGKHMTLFPRAVNLKNTGEIIGNLKDLSESNRLADGAYKDGVYVGDQDQDRVSKTPYIIANVSKLIPEIPAMLVSRSIGQVYPANDLDYTDEIRELQKTVIDEIEEDSNLRFEHYTNILQHQIDGGLVGIVTKEVDDLPLIEMKARDTYFPHADGKGADIALEEEYEDENGKLEEYLHIYRERIERQPGRDPVTKKRNSNLTIEHILYKLGEDRKLEQLSDEETLEKLGLDELKTTYKDRRRGFIHYWANNKTFNNELGVSAMDGQESKQEEINWTLTRNAIVFERNGKPRIAVNKKLMTYLRDKAYDRTGDDSRIDSRDLELIEMDEEGNSIEVFQIDVSKIGSLEWVKDLMKMMFVETQTSEKAVDFYIDGTSTGGAASGIAKFYDLFTSIIKAEKLAKEYVAFLQDLYESALWMERELGEIPELPVDKPDIHLTDMIPISRKELLEQEALAYEKKIQSRYETVKKIKPNDSEESIEDEIALIESENQSDDTNGILGARSTLNNLLDNKDEQVDEDEEESSADPKIDPLKDKNNKAPVTQ